MADYDHLFQSFKSLHRFAERDKNLIFRSIDILAQEKVRPVQQIKLDIQQTLELDEVLIYRYLEKTHELEPSHETMGNSILLRNTVFEQAPFHQKVIVLNHLNHHWNIDSEHFHYANVVWVPINVAGQFIGAVISRSKKQRKDFAIVGEALQMIASNLGYHMKNEELTQKLTAEKDRAEELSRIKSDFLAMMSHELRTPLNGVIGMTELLKEEDLNEKQDEYASIILSSGESLLTLINDILDYSKIDAGKMKLEQIPFSVKKTVREIGTIFRLRLQNNPVQFAINIDDDIPDFLLGDPGRLKQIFNNLLGNAIKFTSKGHIHFNVKLIKNKNERATIRFEVEDTGIGIPHNKTDTIFESFTQESDSTSRMYGGTGLGLSICKKLSHLMHGDVGVESVLGKGSTFWAEASFPISADQVETSGLSPLKKLSELQVLVVDDNPNITQSIQYQLESLKVKTHIAHDGKEALELIAHSKNNGLTFDAIITDRVMTNMDGFDFAKKIQACESSKDIPIIMMTSRGLRGDAQKAQETGLRAFVTKPIRKNLLKRVLQVLTDPAQKNNSELITKYSFEHLDQDFRILVVDDNRINHKVIHNILNDEGFEHDFANNGKQAVDMVREHKYDLIFMDINMPVMDGIEATGIIRNMDDKFTDLPIVALTAKFIEGSDTEYREMGMTDCLSKPFKREQLMSLVSKYSKRGEMCD